MIVPNLAVVQPTFMGAVPRIFEKVYNKVVTGANQAGGVKLRIFEWAMKHGRRASQLRQEGKTPGGLLALRIKIADKLVFSKLKNTFGGRIRFFISGGAPLSRDMAEFFHAAEVLNAAEGGCVCTNDDQLAARLRNIRSSYGAGRPVIIPLTGNGRMSEAQAAMALMSLEDYPSNQKRNRIFFELYTEMLGALPGGRFQSPDATKKSNYQYIILEIDEKEFGLSRDEIIRLLNAENLICTRYFAPGLHRTRFYGERYPQFKEALPMTDRLCRQVMQLPSGQVMNEELIQEVCRLITFAHENAPAIRKKMMRL